MLIFLLGSAAASHAQLLPHFKFELANPGARSLAFGGAFAALADDATAAYANPAGLVQLSRTEVSLELRRWSRPDFFLFGDIGTFGSLVHPHGRWTFALYSQQLTTFETSTYSPGLFRIAEAPFDARDDVELRLSTVSAAAAFRVDEGLSVGFALVRGRGFVSGKREVFVHGVVPPNMFLPIEPERLLATGELAIDDSDLTFSTGVWWSPSERFAAAAFFRQGARFEGTASFTERPGPGGTPSTLETKTTFATPDVVGAGGAYRLPGGRVTLAAEVDRVGYEGLVRAGARSALDGSSRQYRDSWQYRLGVEWAHLASRPVLALRAGTWRESASNERQLQPTIHFSTGIGVAAKHVQVDFGMDFSPSTDTGSFSLIYSF